MPGIAQSLRGESLAPGNRGAGGKEKAEGVIVSWGLKEAQSKSARKMIERKFARNDLTRIDYLERHL